VRAYKSFMFFICASASGKVPTNLLPESILQLLIHSIKEKISTNENEISSKFHNEEFS